MFDIFAKLLSSIASFLFPVFASYKALKTSDPAQLSPWLMYWVVLACALLVESWFEWFLVWIPLYAYIRLLFLLYLILPQTQGAKALYQEYIHPWLEENESSIEDLIATSHDRMRAAGMAYLKQAIEMLKTHLFGLPPSEQQQQQASTPAGPPQTAQSYTHALLARFSLPSARWSGQPAPGTTNNDLYSLFSATLSAATAMTTTTTTPAGHPKAVEAKDLLASPSSSSSSWRPFFSSGATATGSAASLIPDTIRGRKAQMTYLSVQRERLSALMSALDRAATTLKDDEEDDDASGLPRAPSFNYDGAEENSAAAAGKAQLSKSRSEPDFEKLEAESGTEEDNDVGERRTPGAGAGAGGGGGWMPWSWGASSSAGPAATMKSMPVARDGGGVGGEAMEGVERSA